MENQFVPFELAVKLKELGFKRTCLAEYIDGAFYLTTSLNNKKQVLTTASAPLWQQAFDWFREKYNLDSYVRQTTYREWKLEINYILQNDSKEEWEKYKKFQDYKETYEEAKQVCLEKLIELCS